MKASASARISLISERFISGPPSSGANNSRKSFDTNAFHQRTKTALHRSTGRQTRGPVIPINSGSSAGRQPNCVRTLATMSLICIGLHTHHRYFRASNPRSWAKILAGYGCYFTCIFQSLHEANSTRVEIAESAVEYVTCGERIHSPNLGQVDLTRGLSVKVKYGSRAPCDSELLHAYLFQRLEASETLDAPGGEKHSEQIATSTSGNSSPMPGVQVSPSRITGALHP